MASKRYEIDMSSGSMARNIAAFAFPLMLSNVLQLLYNAADVIVVGQFAGSEALAAVGSTTNLINLIINLFIGLATGTSVLVSRYFGAADSDGVGKAVHTSVVLSMIGGVVCCAVGIGFARPILLRMETPGDVIDGATLYMQIFFMGAPASMFYNFGSAILRAVGDTKRPLYILTLSGIVNVILNLILVIGFQLGIAGVAIATVTSQYLSAALLSVCLLRDQGAYQLVIRRLRLHRYELLEILRTGLPAGVSNCVFSLSNIVIQSAVNTFGSSVMAGVAAASNIEGFVSTGLNSLSQAAMTATAQNMGARQEKRIYQSMRISLVFITAIGLVAGGLLVLFREQLLRIYSNDAAVIAAGSERMMVTCLPYCIWGMMDVFVGHLRGMRYSTLPTCISIVGVCGLRILWVFTIFAAHKSTGVLFASLPLSWAVTAAAQYCCILAVRRKAIAKAMAQ